MRTFGVVREEIKKSTRKKMPKIRLILSIICHRYFHTNHFITWFVYFLVYFGDNQLIPLGAGGGLVVFVNKINNLATQGWQTNSGLCFIENKKKIIRPEQSKQCYNLSCTMCRMYFLSKYSNLTNLARPPQNQIICLYIIMR